MGIAGSHSQATTLCELLDVRHSSDGDEEARIEEVAAMIEAGAYCNDMVLGCWFWVLGSVLYLAWDIVGVWTAWTSDEVLIRGPLTLDLVASVFILAASCFFVSAGSRVYTRRLFLQLAPPPDPDMSFWERNFTSNRVLLGAQLWNITWLLYLAEGIWWTVNGYYEDSVEYLGSFALFFPPCLFWAYTARDESMRQQGGRGSSYVFDHVLARFCGCGKGRSAHFWRRHLGSDNVLVLWFFFVVVCLPLTGWCLYTIFDTPTLSAPYLTFAMMVCYTLGTGLYVRGSYRENMGQSSCRLC